MSAERLRKAASLMRELADKADAQPAVDVPVEGVWLRSRFYMATTPSRERAVADLLDSEASLIEAVANHADLHSPLNPARTVLLRLVADAYLGGAA